MTYIIVNQAEDVQEMELQILLEKLFQKSLQKSPDIHELNAEGKNSIGIEKVKDFQKEMLFKPFEEKIQVGIIKEAQKLTSQSQNALLKTLEESSDSTIYILCVNNEKNLLPTILSRGKTLYPTSTKENSTNTGVGEQILQMDLLEQFQTIEKYSKEKDSSLELLNEIEEVFREKLELEIKNGNIDGSKKFLTLLKIVEDSREKISSNCNKRLVLESMIIQLNA